MKGLVLKDFYLLTRYCRNFLLVAFVFLVIYISNPGNTAAITMLCAVTGILPITLLSYDEREGWITYCQTLPYTKAQYVSAKYVMGLIVCLGAMVLLGLLVGAFFTVAGFLLTPWSLRAMGTPEEAMPGAVLYLRVYFLGMVPNVVYNMGTGVLRAIGDFRRPLYFLIAASGCNIVLDLLLVLVFHLDVAGVAIATICSQLLSAVLVVVALLRSEMTPYQLFPRQLHIHPEPMRGILHIGVPTALQSVMYSASNIVIQAAINSFGTDTVAAWTAYGKMDVIFWMTVTAMSQSITTFAGQNYGAGQYQRVKKGLWVSAGMLSVFTIGISAVFFFLARPILTIFTPDAAVLDIGVDMVRFLAPCYITYILIELIAGAVRGAGKSVGPMLIDVFGVCGLRLAWLFLVVPVHHTLTVVMASYPITWTVTSVALLIYYFFGRWLKEPSPAP